MDIVSFCQLFVDTILPIVFALIVTIVQLKKWSFVKKNQRKEVNDLIYRKEDYLTKEETPRQSFDKLVPKFTLNKSTNLLEQTGIVDLQELVQSSCECALDKILEKYGALPPVDLPPVSGSTEVPFDATDMRDDLLVLGDFLSEVEAIRARYNLPQDMSVPDVFSKLKSMKSDVDVKITSALKSQSVNNGGNDNEISQK